MPLDDEDKERLARVEDKLDRVLNGPEGQPEKGWIVRMDRVERVVGAAIKIAMAALLAGAGALWQSITNGNHPSAGSGGHP